MLKIIKGLHTHMHKNLHFLQFKYLHTYSYNFNLWCLYNFRSKYAFTLARMYLNATHKYVIISRTVCVRSRICINHLMRSREILLHFNARKIVVDIRNLKKKFYLFFLFLIFEFLKSFSMHI